MICISTTTPEDETLIIDEIKWYKGRTHNKKESEQEAKESIEATLFLLRKKLLSLEQVHPNNREFFKNKLKEINQKIEKTNQLKAKKKKSKRKKH
jgi:hypothetical protein